MPVQGISHTNIGVYDPEKCLPFCRDVLGLVVALDDDHHQQNAGVVYHRRAIYLRWAGGPAQSFVVLDQQISNKQTGSPPGIAAIGVNHYGFWVDDIDAMLIRARRHGAEILHDAHDSAGRHYGYGGAEAERPRVRTAFLRDPEGNVVQLDQWLA